MSRLGPLPRLLYLIVSALVLWPWCATLSLSVRWFLGSSLVAQRWVALPVATVLLIPFGITALLGIYAVRRRAGQSAP